jgi:hypothetical protein
MGTAVALSLKRDAIELLRAEHRAVEAQLEQFELLAVSDAGRAAAAAEIGRQLTYHTMLEEDIFLPEVEAVVHTVEARRAIWIARLENDLTNTLVERSEAVLDDALLLDAIFSVLIPLVRRHMDAQEATLFPLLHDAGIDRRLMAARISAHRAEVERALVAEHTYDD